MNAFDLVRLHKFGDQDDEAKPDTPANKLPSYTAMCAFSVADAHVASLLNKERYEAATATFTNAPMPGTDENCMSLLAVSATTGTPAKTRDNIKTILRCDPLLADKVALDEFANRVMALRPLPWSGG